MATSSEILPVAQRAAVGVYEAEGYTVTGYGPSDVELTHDDGHELLGGFGETLGETLLDWGRP